MMLADPEGIDADLVRQHAFRDDVADDLRMGQESSVRADRDVAKSVQSEFECLCHGVLLKRWCGSVLTLRTVDVSTGQRVPGITSARSRHYIGLETIEF